MLRQGIGHVRVGTAEISAWFTCRPHHTFTQGAEWNSFYRSVLILENRGADVSLNFAELRIWSLSCKNTAFHSSEAVNFDCSKITANAPFIQKLRLVNLVKSCCQINCLVGIHNDFLSPFNCPPHSLKTCTCSSIPWRLIRWAGDANLLHMRDQFQAIRLKATILEWLKEVGKKF